MNDVFDIKNEEDFKTKVLESKKPVIVDFHAIWCGPCLELTPILTDIVEERDGNVDLAKVNIDNNQELAIRYGVASIPTVLLMRNGKMSKSFVGLISHITFLFIYIISIYIYFKVLSLLLLSRDRTLFALDMTFFHCKISRFRLGQNIS